MPKESPSISPIERARILQDLIAESIQAHSVTKAEVTSLLKNLQDMMESDHKHIVRGMELTSDQHMAGLVILNYFPRLIEQLHPDIAFSTSITKTATHVKMVIESDETSIHIIEEILEQYSLVLLGKSPLNQLVTAASPLMELKQMLDLSALITNINHNMHAGEDIAGKAPDLEKLVKKLHTTLGYGLSGISELQNVISTLLNEEKESINQSLAVLRSRLHYKMNDSDMVAVKEALQTVRAQEPGAFEDIRKVINRYSESGAAGDTLYSWIASLSRILPS